MYLDFHSILVLILSIVKFQILAMQEKTLKTTHKENAYED